MNAPATPVRYEDEHGSRYYIHPVTGEQYISVTTILGATEGKPYLTPWSARLAAEYAIDQRGLVRKTLRQRGRKAAIDLIKDEAKRLRERKADAGTYVHDVQEALILWAASPDHADDIALPTLPEHLAGADYDGEPLDEVVDWMVTGFTNFVSDFSPRFEAAEMPVYSPAMKVAGTLDMIVEIGDVALTPDGTITHSPGSALIPCMDTKTGKYLSATVREQLAAYRRMREALMPLGEIRPMPPTNASAVLHLRPEHADCYRFMPISAADDAKAWNLFRRATELYQGRAEAGPKPGKVVRPLCPDGTTPPALLADLTGSGYGRAPSLLRGAGLRDVEDVAAFTAEELHGIDGIGEKTADMARRMLADHGLTLADEAPAAGKVA